MAHLAPTPSPHPAASARLAALHLHPIKSCGTLQVEQAELVDTGLDLDRAWMVTDPHGEMLTQREHPRLALVQPSLRGSELVLRAPGMLALHLRVDTVEAATRVRVWDDIVRAFDMGALAAQWFSDYLGVAARIVRFDPDEERLSEPRWTSGLRAQAAFADGFALLVANAASLADLNRRLQADGHEPVTMARFRPNLVLEGLPAWEEDHLHEIDIASAHGTVTLRLAKPCVRCTVPDVDPATAATGHAVADTLARFRADPRMNGGLTFGVNAFAVQGLGHTLRRGDAVVLRHAFA